MSVRLVIGCTGTDGSRAGALARVWLVGGPNSRGVGGAHATVGEWLALFLAQVYLPTGELKSIAETRGWKD